MVCIEVKHNWLMKIIKLNLFLFLVSPNSLDCQWTISAPPGRRLQFTIDAETFNLQTTHDFDLSANESLKCDEDYLEIRDGASIHSPFMGRYCSLNAPSTIFSTGEHLHLHYVTDSMSQSPGWNATYELGSFFFEIFKH